MQVTLISYTPDAAELLIFTKNTRLKMHPGGLQEIKQWSAEEKAKALAEISNTIKSSWEFVGYTFMIEGVSRAFTHQLVRTRAGTYAQQTMRVLNVSEAGQFQYVTGPSILQDTEASDIYHNAMYDLDDYYKKLIELGVEIEDARGILPTNIQTNIVATFSLRTLNDLFLKRDNIRVQGEYREFLGHLLTAVSAIHPWAAKFILPKDNKAYVELNGLLEQLKITNKELAILIAKQIDIIKAESNA